MMLLCQVTPSTPGVAPWGRPSLCQMITAASLLVKHPETLLLTDAVPLALAVKLLVLPEASPHGVNRPLP